jgi:hypothetical protein
MAKSRRPPPTANCGKKPASPRSGRIRGKTHGWVTYDLPPELLGKVWGGKYRGQKQKWFLFIPELYVSAESAQKLKIEAGNLLSWDLTARQVCDLELLMNGGFNPLKGFLSQADYDGVVENMRLANGTLWPIPITLDVGQAFADKIEPGRTSRCAMPKG